MRPGPTTSYQLQQDLSDKYWDVSTDSWLLTTIFCLIWWRLILIVSVPAVRWEQNELSRYLETQILRKKCCPVQRQEQHGSHNLHVLMDLLNCINHQTFKIWMKTKKLPSWIACLSSNFCLNISTIIFFLPWLCNKQLFTRLTETL